MTRTAQHATVFQIPEWLNFQHLSETKIALFKALQSYLFSFYHESEGLLGSWY